MANTKIAINEAKECYFDEIDLIKLNNLIRLLSKTQRENVFNYLLEKKLSSKQLCELFGYVMALLSTDIFKDARNNTMSDLTETENNNLQKSKFVGSDNK